MVDFTIDRMLTELRNESKTDNDSILLFPPIGKQDISPSQQNKPFNSSSFNFFAKKNLRIDMQQIKKILKLENIVIIHANIEVLHTHVI